MKFLLLLSSIFFMIVFSYPQAKADVQNIYMSNVRGVQGNNIIEYLIKPWPAAYLIVQSRSLTGPPEIIFDGPDTTCPVGVPVIYCKIDFKWCIDKPGTYDFNVSIRASATNDFINLNPGYDADWAFHLTILDGNPNYSCPQGPDTTPTPTPTPSPSATPIPTPSATPIIDLSVDQISVIDAKIEADQKPSISPTDSVWVYVSVSGRNVQPSDNRSTLVTLDYGPNTLAQYIPLSYLANGASYNVPFLITYSNDDIGLKKLHATINSGNVLGEVSLGNNADDKEIHILCDANKINAVKFFAQAVGPWGDKRNPSTNYVFGPYGEITSKGETLSPAHRMSAFGCYLTNVAMVMNTYGIKNTAQNLNIPVGVVQSAPPKGPLTSLDPGTLNLAGRLQKFNGSYTMFDKKNNPNGYGLTNYGRLAWGAECTAGNNGSATCSQQMGAQISHKGTLKNYDRAFVEKQICSGNPIILELSIPEVPATPTKKKKPAHSHFVLANAMTVDSDGNPSFIINDPGTSQGENLDLYDAYPSSKNPIIGQRVYVHAADPSFFRVDATSTDTDYVVTDAQGRRTGYNPITKQSFNEIPGAVYYKEFSPNEDPDDNSSNEDPSTIMINDQAADVGQYKIDVYRTSAGNVDLQIEGYDVNGFLNQVLPISQSVKAGGHVLALYQHEDKPLSDTQINTQRAWFYDANKNKEDRVIFDGKIVMPSGSSTIDVTKFINITIGDFNKRLDVKQLRRNREHKGYSYNYHSKDFSFKLDNQGNIEVIARNSGFNISRMTPQQQIDIQVDDIYATSQVKFKIFDKNCKDYDHDYNKFDFFPGLDFIFNFAFDRDSR